MRLFSIILLVVISSGMLLGSITIVHNMDHIKTSCLGSLVTSEQCPLAVSGLTNHRIGTIKIFSGSIISWIWLLLILLVVLGLKERLNVVNVRSSRLASREYTNLNQSKRKITAWLSLLEHSPSF